MATHTNSGLDARLSFMRIDTQTINYIRELKPIIDRELPVALDRFYAQLRATPEVRRFFQNEAHMDRAKGAQVNHWSGMSSGVFDDRYVANVQTIGRTHARIGLEPRWYIGGYALIVEHLISAITTENAANARLWSRKQRLDSAQLGAAIGALVKVVMLDMDFSISVYIDAAEEGRRQAEDEAKAAERSLVSGSFGVGLQRLASKDLSYRMTEDLPPEYRQLQMDFNAALDQMEAAVEGVQSSAGIIASGSAEVTSAADDLSKRTEQQDAS